MTSKDKFFIAKVWGVILAAFYLVMFSYYAAQSRYLWDDALVMAADKTFWCGVVIALVVWGVLRYIKRHHERKDNHGS